MASVFHRCSLPTLTWYPFHTPLVIVDLCLIYTGASWCMLVFLRMCILIYNRAISYLLSIGSTRDFFLYSWWKITREESHIIFFPSEIVSLLSSYKSCNFILVVMSVISRIAHFLPHVLSAWTDHLHTADKFNTLQAQLFLQVPLNLMWLFTYSHSLFLSISHSLHTGKLNIPWILL